jgi:hypothetical protein
MLRITACLVAACVAAGTASTVSAQTPAPAASASATTAKPSRIKLTVEHLKEMRAKWKANKPKLAACRKEVKSQDLHGDDRWFYIEDCMSKI